MTTIKNAFYMNQYDNLSTFETVEEMDNMISIAKNHYADALTHSQIEVLEFIAQHSVKVVGVAKLLVPTIAEGIGKSIRTVNYATKKLEDLGIIKRHQTMRKKQGGSGASVYVICNDIADRLQTDCRPIADCPPSEIPCESKDEQPKIETETLSKTLSQSPIQSLRSFEKNNNHNLVKSIELEDEPLFADTPESLRLAYALVNSSLGNQLTKRIVSAYKNSGLASSTAWSLQDRCKHDSTFARELGDRVSQSIRNKKDSSEDEICGYVYTTALNMFNDYLTHDQVDNIDTEKEFDWFNNDVTRNLLNAKIIYPNYETSCAYINRDVETEFNNDDLPW
ncbi:helix-turn-helix domain-containing protein [Bacillus cereus]|nr:helix-turn-helix domain-containing protein [Bacillus cereus]